MPKSSAKNSGLSAPKSVESLSYEQAFAELESIVAALENEQRSLDESMALYERGQALMKHCAKILDKAELKVKQLSGDALGDFEEAE
ncbi:MAG TPA: exodeoxyribonuclease VII small subunit [Anaerolineales bacterium]